MEKSAANIHVESRHMRRQAWISGGYFFVRGLVSSADVPAIEDEVVTRIRADAPDRHPGETTYLSGDNYLTHVNRWIPVRRGDALVSDQVRS